MDLAWKVTTKGLRISVALLPPLQTQTLREQETQPRKVSCVLFLGSACLDLC